MAEEGVDFEELQLVVSMNPPTNVTALVQMRGRARKKGSSFLILCNSREEKSKLDLLLKGEEQMMEASRRCASED